MTLTQLQAAIHSLYAGDAETPDSTSGEWSVRLNYIKAAINAWDTETGMLWNELWTTRVLENSGDATITSADLTYTTPTNLRMLGGHVRTYTSLTEQAYWEVIKPEEASIYKNAGWQFVYLTGNTKAGFTINFSGQPTVGDTIDYPYYKTATEPSSGSDVIEMSDPYFAVYFTLSKLYENDGEGDRATFAMSQAENKLSAMKTHNAMLPPYQFNGVQSVTTLMTGSGFGN